MHTSTYLCCLSFHSSHYHFIPIYFGTNLHVKCKCQHTMPIKWANSQWMCVLLSCCIGIWDDLALGSSAGNPRWWDLCARDFMCKGIYCISLCAVSPCHRAPPLACSSHFSTQPVHTKTHTLSHTESTSLMFKSQLVFLLHLESSLVTGDIMEREESD